MLNQRARQLNSHTYQEGPIIYWMIRDQRVHDNWALLYAQQQALEQKVPLMVVFCLRRNLKEVHGTARLLDFMLEGLDEIHQTLRTLHIPFQLILADESPDVGVLSFIKEYKVGTVVTDFSPLNEQRTWKQGLLKNIAIPFYEVDTHNIVPCWIASNKQEFGAYTIRPKIHKLLDTYLTEIPAIKNHPYHIEKSLTAFDKKAIRKMIQVDEAVQLPKDRKSGESAALKQLDTFISVHLDGYATLRNDPNAQHTSHLSAYLHFGQISSQRIALTVSKSRKGTTEDRHSFLEELVIRKELSDNFCFYNPHYSSTKGFPNWAKKTLTEHKDDVKEFTYTKREFEEALTHDDLWNSAQLQMVKNGYMHGYLRMYWAKKIFEWTVNVDEAMNIAVHLNDKYQLDGRDPNGYTGIAWSMGGVHDRAWFDRPIFGKIRYMNVNGAKKKFDTQKFIDTWQNT